MMDIACKCGDSVMAKKGIFMKYYSPALWLKSQCASESDGELYKTLDENRKNYNEAYQKTRSRLSKKFVRIYETNHFFHDWHIESVTYINTPNKVHDRFVMQIANPPKKYELSFYKVQDFKMQINGLETGLGLIRGIEEFSYAEFLPAEHNRISFELLTPTFSSIFFTCKGVTVKAMNR